jgi:hypothetical protein
MLGARRLAGLLEGLPHRAGVDVLGDGEVELDAVGAARLLDREAARRGDKIVDLGLVADVDLPGELALDVGDDRVGALEVLVALLGEAHGVVALLEDLRGAVEVAAELPVAVAVAVDEPAKPVPGVVEQELLPGVGDAVDDAAAPADADDLALDAVDDAAGVQRQDRFLVLARGGGEQLQGAAVGRGEGAAAVGTDDLLLRAEAVQGDRAAAREALDR